MQQRSSRWITYSATCGGIGFAPLMPGTVGSLLAFPLWWGVLHALPHPTLWTVLGVGSVIVVLLFFFGVYVTDLYSKQIAKEDPKEAVIDEVVGQMMVLVATYPYYAKVITMGMMPEWVWVVCFILFRVFDIIKPWPIRLCEEKVKGGWGIMVDDILAAVFAIILFVVTMKSSGVSLAYVFQG